MYWYDVTPFKETQWAILVESQRLPHSYDKKGDALQAAVSAAAENCDKHGIASGVRFRDDRGRLQVLVGATRHPLRSPFSLHS